MNFAREIARHASLPTVQSSQLARDYKQRIADQRALVSSSIELTYRCNLHCSHCYCPPGERDQELTTDELLRAIDDLAEMGNLFLLLTGGDPLLRPDFHTIYRRAKEQGMLVTVFTNGVLIDDRLLELWEELPPSLVEISLYGLTREVYEKVVAVKDSYDRCLAGIARVLGAGHPLALKCPATTENAHEIRALSDFAHDLGVDFRYDPVILATMDGRRDPHALRLRPEAIAALDAGDVEKDRAWKKYMVEERRELPAQKLFTCGAGKNSLHIDPYGNVQVCLMVKNFRHSLREKPLSRIYREDFPRILALEREPDSKCGTCPSRATCGSCPGVALWETRDVQSHVDFQCQLNAVREQTYVGALADAAGAEPESGCGSCSAGGSGGLIQIGGTS